MAILSCVRFWLWRGFGRASISLIVFVVAVIIDCHVNCARTFFKAANRTTQKRCSKQKNGKRIACPPHPIFFFSFGENFLRFLPPHFDFIFCVRNKAEPNVYFSFTVQHFCSFAWGDWPLGTMMIIIMPFTILTHRLCLLLTVYLHSHWIELIIGMTVCQ